jgi:hypothetical protein
VNGLNAYLASLVTGVSIAIRIPQQGSPIATFDGVAELVVGRATFELS